MVKPYRDPRDEEIDRRLVHPRVLLVSQEVEILLPRDPARLRPEVSRKRVGILRRITDWIGSLLRPRTTAPCLLLAAPCSLLETELAAAIEERNIARAEYESARDKLVAARRDRIEAPWAQDVPMPEPPITRREMGRRARPPATAIPGPGERSRR